MPHDAFLLLLLYLYRLANALLCRTFFQPDEFWQTLEVAHRWVNGFGYATWEWRPENALRSPLVPLLYTPAYLIARRYDPVGVRGLHILLPKLIQAFWACLVDLYTYKLAQRLLGERRAAAALLCACTSLASAVIVIRPFANTVETALTAMALSKWPWDGRSSSRSLPACLALVACACVIRPPSIVVWAALAAAQLVQTPSGRRFGLFWALFSHALPIDIGASFYSFALDSWYYGRTTWTPLNFVRVNVVDNLSLFYGANDWSYYLVQGIPALGFVWLPQIWRGARAPTSSDVERAAVRSLLAVVAVTLFAYSCLGHKEIRFVMPLLPIINVLAARGMPARLSRPALLARVALVGAPSLYLLQWHMRGQVDILAAVRAVPRAELRSLAFLTPCHSTPWQAHLFRPELDGPDSGAGGRLWFITCEPPLGANATTYVDQSDVFYVDPAAYLRGCFPPTVDAAYPPSPVMPYGAWRHAWPSHLVVFEALLSRAGVADVLAERGYGERARVWNSHVHEDPRRAGALLLLEHGRR